MQQSNHPSVLTGRRRALVLLAVASGLFLGGWSFLHQFQALRTPFAIRSDLTQDYVSSVAWRQGADPYRPTPQLVDRYLGPETPYYSGVLGPSFQRNPHPPAGFLAAAPFSYLAFDDAVVVWFFIMSAALVLAIFLAAREMIGGLLIPFALGVGSLALPTAQLSLIHTHLTPLLLLLLVLAWLGLRRGFDGVAGVALGAAAALRLFPVFMLIPLIRQRRTRAAKAMLLALGVFTTATVALVGASATADFAVDVAPANNEYWRSAPGNVSATAVPFRWLTTSTWLPNAVDLPILAMVLAGVVFVACILASLRTPARASGDVFWSAVPWMLLATPLSWDHTAILAYALILLMILRLKGERGPGSWLALIAIALVVIGTSSLVDRPLPDTNLAWLALVYALPTYGLIILGLREWSGQSPAAQDWRGGVERVETRA